MNANDLKDQGNMYFAARRFNDAVSCYTKAIVSTAPLAYHSTLNLLLRPTFSAVIINTSH